MKKSKRHIIYAWIVLVCFVAGQVMVSAHQHLVKYHMHQIAQNQPTVTEKCQLCDVMHHNCMTITEHHYFVPLVSSDHFYKQGKYDFISIALVLASGRAPPLS